MTTDAHDAEADRLTKLEADLERSLGVLKTMMDAFRVAPGAPPLRHTGGIMTTDARGEVVSLTMLEAELERGLGGLRAMMDALRTTKQRRRDHPTASEFP